jgi:hypothetical protein
VRSDDLRVLREAGASINVGLVDDHGHPVAARAFGARVTGDDPLRFDLLLGEALLASLGRGPGSPPFPIAVTLSAIALFRSFQVKGMARDVRLPEPEHVAAAETDNAVLFEVLHQRAGAPRRAFDLVMPRHVLAVTVEAAEAYDQTPGPGAGRALAGPS